MTVYKATSSAALSGAAVLKPEPEMAKTNKFYNRVTNTGLQAFSLMHNLEGRNLHNTILVTYSNSKSRFCRPF